MVAGRSWGQTRGTGRRCSRTFGGAGSKRSGSSLLTTFQVLKRRSGRSSRTRIGLSFLRCVRTALNQARRKDREALAEDLKALYRAETGEEAKGALGLGLSPDRCALGGQISRSTCLPSPSKAYQEVPLHHKPVGAPEQGSEAADEGGGFSREEAVEKLLYLVLRSLFERSN